MAVDAFVLAQQACAAIEHNMGRTSGIAEAIRILNKHIDHPEIDRVIDYLKGQYTENQNLWQMIKALEKSVRGRKIEVEYEITRNSRA